MLDPASEEYAAADNLFSKGKGHLFGVLAIEQAARANAIENDIDDIDQYIFTGRYSASLHMLVGFAAELLTKAAFIAHGGSLKDAKKLGHDLIAILDVAERMGVEAPDPNTREIFGYLQEPHLYHQFRYGDVDQVPMADLKHTIPALQALSDYVQNALGIEA